MNEHRTRELMESFWVDVDADATLQKNAMSATLRLIDLYRSFDGRDRELANRVLAEWVLSDNEAKRFDALVLIGEFKVIACRGALSQLASRLQGSASPSAPFELEKIQALMDELASTA